MKAPLSMPRRPRDELPLLPKPFERKVPWR